VLVDREVLATDTQGQTIRLALPLVISATDLERGIEQLAEALISDPRSRSIVISHP
jgi:acetylornithine/succinyldiaminopimelate/putrescine aminotransferase